MELLGRRFIITGKVQGVFFRDSTRTKAMELNITGWVRNISGGRVECIAYGFPEEMAHFEAWLWQGPSKAVVDTVKSEALPIEEYDDFTIHYQA